MTTTAAQLSFLFFLIQNTSLVLFEVVIQLFFFLASCEDFFFQGTIWQIPGNMKCALLNEQQNTHWITEKHKKNPKQMIKRMFPKSVQR